MKMWSNVTLFVLIFSLIISCDKDPIQKGDEAFKNEQFLDAQKYYEQALKEDPQSNELKGKLLITYFMNGENYYKTRKLLPAFEGQIKQGFAYLPEPVPDSLKEIIGETLLQLAEAYREYPAENEYQKKEFSDKAIHYLKTGLEYDSSNSAIRDALKDIKEKEIGEIIKKGELYYEAGEQKSENYLTAQYYFEKALELESDNQDAAKKLRLTKKKLLTIYNYEQFTPIKISGQSKVGKLIVFDISILNNTNKVMDLKGDGFYLIASDSSRLGGFFSEEFSMPYITKKLGSRQEAKGVVSFEPTSNKRFVRLEYKGGGKLEGYKNLP